MYFSHKQFSDTEQNNKTVKDKTKLWKLRQLMSEVDRYTGYISSPRLSARRRMLIMEPGSMLKLV